MLREARPTQGNADERFFARDSGHSAVQVVASDREAGYRRASGQGPGSERNDSVEFNCVVIGNSPAFLRPQAIRCKGELSEGLVGGMAVIIKKGSSRITWIGGLDLEEEVGAVAVAVGHTLDDLDAVVDAFELAGVHRPAHPREDAAPVSGQFVSKALERFDPARASLRQPVPPGATPLPRGHRLPEFLEHRFKDVDGHQGLIGFQQFVQLDLAFGRQILAVAQQQPTRPLDHAPLRAIMLEPIGFVDAQPVDHFPAVFGDHVIQVVHDRAFGQRSCTSRSNAVFMVSTSRRPS